MVVERRQAERGQENRKGGVDETSSASRLVLLYTLEYIALIWNVCVLARDVKKYCWARGGEYVRYVRVLTVTMTTRLGMRSAATKKQA